MRALVSPFDKSGLVAFSSGLVELGWEIVASGGTAALLAGAGIAVLDVASVTGVAEMLDGRVKTLHPALHAGILADRGKPDHLSQLRTAGFEAIDLVVCNLYPFVEHPSVENIDVGGVAMVRAAAKSWADVGVVTDPADYPGVLEELRSLGRLGQSTRLMLAQKAFSLTASYDAAIASWMSGPDAAEVPDPSAGADPPKGGEQEGPGELLPASLTLHLERVAELRYGENPHQRAARYRWVEPIKEGASTGQPVAWVARQGWWEGATLQGGKELSYSNVLDAEAAWQLVWELAEADAAAVVVKHASPCGVAIASDLARACAAALACDPLSAFGGIVACSYPLDAETAAVLVDGPQADVIITPQVSVEAAETLLARRKATRIISAPRPLRPPMELRALDGGLVLQEADRCAEGRKGWRLVTEAAPTAQGWKDLELAWRICARVLSNAVVLASLGASVGIGGGQPARVEAARLAVGRAGARAQGAAAASDAFFPFRDGLDALADAGVNAVVAPGGSVRDGEIAVAAAERGVALVFAEERHFRH